MRRQRVYKREEEEEGGREEEEEEGGRGGREGMKTKGFNRKPNLRQNRLDLLDHNLDAGVSRGHLGVSRGRSGVGVGVVEALAAASSVGAPLRTGESVVGATKILQAALRVFLALGKPI